MTVEHVEVLVEEPSMETALRLLLPRILGERSGLPIPEVPRLELLDREAVFRG